MQKVTVLIFFACCALSALSLAKDTKNSKPSSSMAPARGFTSRAPSTTTTSAKNTTTKATTKAQNTTTKAPPTTTKAQHTTTKVTTKPPHTTTKPQNTTKATTKPPHTTTKPQNTTTKATTKPPHTTTKPQNTTTKATTKPPHTTTKPQNTTTTATTKSPTPTPQANVTVGNYTLKNNKGEFCLMAEMALQIRLVLQKTTGIFTVQPQQTNTSGSCTQTKANLTLFFRQGSIVFLFNKSAADNIVYVDSLSFTLNYPLNKGTNVRIPPYNARNTSLHLFPAKIGHSYSCKSESVYMGNNLYLDVEKSMMQAFNITENKFGNSDPCPADRPDYRVAIAVGVTLLVLIVIVLVVYLLGRRRRTAGYQSL